jgi:uncharacterized protein YgfB (UPF0149 family)
MNYTELQLTFGEMADNCPAEQWHGLLCGLICSGRPTSVDLLHRLMVETNEINLVLGDSQKGMLEQLLEETAQQLAEGQFAFNLLLPDDDEDLSLRTRALSDWCDAFLFGLSAGGLNRDTELAPDLGEFIADLTEISRVEFQADTASEDDEYDFNELVEYIRVGVLLAYDELNPVGTAKQTEH